MANPTTNQTPARPKEASAKQAADPHPTDAELVEASHLIHGAPLRGAKVLGGHVEGLNSKGQTVTFARKTIIARMAAGEFTRPDQMPDQAEAEAEADPVGGDAGPETDPS